MQNRPNSVDPFMRPRYKRIHVRSSFYDIVARLEMESILQLNSDMQASCKYLPRSCCPTAGTVRHGGTGTCMRVCLCCAYALLWRQWDNSCVEDIYMKPGPHDRFGPGLAWPRLGRTQEPPS